MEIDDNNVLSHSYDHTGQRVYKELTSSENQETEHTSTYYPSQYFERQVFYIEDDPESSSTTTIRHIFLGNQMIANLTKKDQEDWNTSYILSDHLGSSSVILDSSGVIQTLYDYYPFGGTRLEHTEGEMEMAGMHTDYRYTGQEQDEETGLYYYGARYYDQGVGRFTQADPLALYLTNEKELKNKTGKDLMEILSHPIALNAYAYANNNPVLYVDPTGDQGVNVFFFLSQRTQVAIGNWANRAYDNNAVARYAMDHPYQTGATLGVLGGGVAAGAVVLSGGAVTCGIICGGTAATVATTGATAATQGDKIEKAAEQGTKLLNGPINITVDRLGHVISEHTPEGLRTLGNSIFNKGENVINLIKQGTQQVIEKQAFGPNFQRVFDVGRNIGVDRVTGQQTSIMTIITNSASKMITAFPGAPNY